MYNYIERERVFEYICALKRMCTFLVIVWEHEHIYDAKKVRVFLVVHVRVGRCNDVCMRVCVFARRCVC